MGLAEHREESRAALGAFVLTVSDSRSLEDDEGGQLIRARLEGAGHRLAGRELVRDEVHAIQEAVRAATARADVDLVLVTGGTGLAARDVTPEAIEPSYDPPIPGFGELFRALSFEEIGAAAMLSRASAGVIGGRVVVLLPGSPKAVELAMDRLVLPEAGHLCSQAASRRP